MTVFIVARLKLNPSFLTVNGLNPSLVKSKLSMIICVNLVLKRTVSGDIDCPFDNLCRSYRQIQSFLLDSP